MNAIIIYGRSDKSAGRNRFASSKCVEYTLFIYDSPKFKPSLMNFAFLVLFSATVHYYSYRRCVVQFAILTNVTPIGQGSGLELRLCL